MVDELADSGGAQRGQPVDASDTGELPAGEVLKAAERQSGEAHEASRPEPLGATDAGDGPAPSGPRRSAAFRLIKGALLIVGAAILIVVLVVAGVGSYLYATYHSDAEAPPPGGPSGLWLGHTWVGQSHAPAQYQALARELSSARIGNVFVHVGPLDGDGAIPPARYWNAPALLAALHGLDRGVRVQAWVGQLVAPYGPLRLGEPAVRARIEATASRLLGLGFDGIHYDLEPILSGNAAFVSLLDATFALTKDDHRLLSVSAPPSDPTPFGFLIDRLDSGYQPWSLDYYRRVATRVNQIAVMTYGHGFPTTWAYGSYVRAVTHQLLSALPRGPTVLVGLPTYDVVGWGVFQHAETLQAGLRGIREGIAALPPREAARAGVAIYAEWTTDPAQWRAFRQSWLGQRG